MQVMDFKNANGEKRLFSRNFRKSVIENMFDEPFPTDDQVIIMPTDFLIEFCQLEDRPPCFFLFENNMQINPLLKHNDETTEFIVRKADETKTNCGGND